jgi:hypothetical protein
MMVSTPAIPGRWAFGTRLDLGQGEETLENKQNPSGVMRRHFQRPEQICPSQPEPPQ